MDELTTTFEEKLKISALSKLKDVNNLNVLNCVTIGPNANISKAEENIKTDCVKNLKKSKSITRRDPSLTNNKLYVEFENLRKQNVRKVTLDKTRFFLEEENKIKENLKQLREKSEKETRERFNQHDKLLNHEILKIDLEAKKETALLEELRRVQEKKRSEDALRIQNKHLELQRVKFLDSLIQYQTEFRKEFKGIYADDENNEVIPNYEENLVQLNGNMEKILTDFDAQNGNIYVENAYKIVNKIKEIRKNVGEELEKLRLKKIEEVRQKEEELKQLEAKKIEEAEKITDANAINSETGVSENTNTQSYYETYTAYKNLQEYLKSYEESYKNLLNDERYKKYRFDCQKAINMPINAITAVSGAHLTDKLNRLSKFLSGQTVEVANVRVSIGQHPEAVAYCTDLLAKKFVLQGDLMVSSNPKAAFPFAAVIVGLWNEFPDFGKLLLAHFHKECVYLVPLYPVQEEGQTNEDYYKALGYRYTDGIVEEHDKFLKRLTGIIRLYAAIIVTKQRQAKRNIPNPHGLECGWRWLASILNLEPRIDVTATLLFNFLDVAGSSMLIAYGKQFKKIISYIYEIFYPRMTKIDSGGPVVRLHVFLNSIIKSRRIQPPEGTLADNFW